MTLKPWSLLLPQATGGAITHFCGGILGRKSAFFLLKAFCPQEITVKMQIDHLEK